MLAFACCKRLPVVVRVIKLLNAALVNALQKASALLITWLPLASYSFIKIILSLRSLCYVQLISSYVPKLLNFIDAFHCYKQLTIAQLLTYSLFLCQLKSCQLLHSCTCTKRSLKVIKITAIERPYITFYQSGGPVRVTPLSKRSTTFVDKPTDKSSSHKASRLTSA